MQLDLFFAFVSEQFLLVLALMATFVMLFIHESRKAGPSLTPQEAITLVNREGGIFLDIRDAAEFKRGHIADAKHITLSQLSSRLGELDKYREQPVVVVCKLGQSAAGATKLLRAQGFDQARKMTGGMMEWNALKLPVVAQ